MSTFSSLKKNNTDFDKLREKVKGNQGYTQEDTFQPGTDAAHNGYAIVRLLPAEDNENHIVSYQNWEYKKGAKVYKNKSRRSIGQPDPCQKLRSALYNMDDESRMEIKKKNVTVGFVYVIEDKIKPDNVGKVLKYYMPRAIVDKIQEAIDPKESPFGDTPEPHNPFNVFKGRNLHIKVKEKDGWNNYDDSKFLDEVGSWLDSEEKMEEMYKQVKPLAFLLEETSYKSYDDLFKQLIEVTGKTDLIREIFEEEFENLGSTNSNEKKEESKKPKEPEKKEEPKKSEEEKKASTKPADIDPEDSSGDEEDFSNFDFDD